MSRIFRAGALAPPIGLAFLIAVGVARHGAAQDDEPDGNFRNPEAIERVVSGESTTANAAWWGFDPADATDAVQSAIDSGAAKVVIPYTGKDWIVQPIRLSGNQELVLEPGVVVAAKPGRFHGVHDALFTGREVSNLKITGYGAVARMRKADYATDDYASSEWRHVLALFGATQVEVVGLTLKRSGGDGVYIGPTWDDRRIPCRDVRLIDCVCEDNLRQGVSVVSGENVRIEKCVFRNTRGRAPQAGIDIEPAHPRDLAVNIEVRNCLAVDNAGSGLFVNLSRLSRKSKPVSVRFQECVVRNSRQPGFRAVLHNDADPVGAVEFINCTCEGTDYPGAMAVWNGAAETALRFIDTKWRDVARRSSSSPIHLELYNTEGENKRGGVVFDNCYVYDDKPRPPVHFSTRAAVPTTSAVRGKLHVINNRRDSSHSHGAERLPDLHIIHQRSQE